MRKVGFFTFSLLLFTTAIVLAGDSVVWPVLGEGKQAIYDSIFEPRIVGVPPGNSGPDYFYVSDDGVLRLSGYGRYGNRTYVLSMDSHDLGLNWETKISRGESYYGFRKCPWADYRLKVSLPQGGQKDRTKGNCSKLFKDASGRMVTTNCPVEGAVSYGHLVPIVSRNAASTEEGKRHRQRALRSPRQRNSRKWANLA